MRSYAIAGGLSFNFLQSASTLRGRRVVEVAFISDFSVVSCHITLELRTVLRDCSWTRLSCFAKCVDSTRLQAVLRIYIWFFCWYFNSSLHWWLGPIRLQVGRALLLRKVLRSYAIVGGLLRSSSGSFSYRVLGQSKVERHMSRFINSPCYDLDKNADITIPPDRLFPWMVVLIN